MTYIDLKQVQTDLELAIERQEYEGGRESICKIMQSIAPRSHEYWYEVACELHRREHFYESLECWREAEKYLPKSEEDQRYWYQEMVETLINSFDQTGDTYFRQQAIDASERLISLNDGEAALNYQLELAQHSPINLSEVLALIEKIFDGGFQLNVKVSTHNLGIKHVDFIESMSDLAECYLWLDRPADAMRLWSKAIGKNKNDENYELCKAIYVLNWYADSQGFDDDSFLSEGFGRIKN